MSGRSPEQLFGLLDIHVRQWPMPRLREHGFDLAVGTGAASDAARRLQAQRVLASEVVLEDLVSIGQDLGESPCLFKGLEVAHLYRRPFERPSRDVDVVVGTPDRWWNELVARGYEPGGREIEVAAHHHLPQLLHPRLPAAVEIHRRPNIPGWARSLPEEFSRAQQMESRTRVAGVLRPPDDLHALLIAVHGWKGGFARLRDLFDAVLLASVSPSGVGALAQRLGLARFWKLTTELVDRELLGVTSHRPGPTVLAATALIERAKPTTARVVAPMLVAAPWHVFAAHYDDARIGRTANRLRATDATR